MKVSSILMSAPMVCASLEDTKSQTRRIVAGQPEADEVIKVLSKTKMADGGYARSMWIAYPQGESVPREKTRALTSPYGIRGDRLLVKEASWMWCERVPSGRTPTGRQKWSYQPMRSAPIYYAAEHPERPDQVIPSPVTGNEWGWRFKVGRFMPRWAIRLQLHVEDVRIEQLQDISDADCIAEGIWKTVSGNFSYGDEFNPSYTTPRDAYSALWDQINGDGSWDRNPWVWVINFSRLQGKPILESTRFADGVLQIQ